MTYNCLGNNLYEITLIMYVDCGPTNTQETTFDESGLLSIYDSSNNLIETIEITNPEVTELSDETVGNDCLTLPTDLCILMGVYTVIVELPPILGGYQLVYQRCCRNPSIINIDTPAQFGNTYTTNIPGSELISDCNSSPSFNAYPPLALCLGDDINVNLSATDPDGDELIYTLTTPFHGADNTNPTLITPPPFTPIPWSAGYSENYPIDANPAINIDANTGIITGTPNQMGMYIIGIKVDEYRDGVLINSVVRDFRFLIVDCDVITSSIPFTSWYCNTLTVSFTNGSLFADTYLWDFGDANASSTEFEPNYTYPDTGNYTVTLIANPNTVCADTNTVTFPLYTELNPIFTAPDPQCVGNNSFTFEGEGIIPEGAVFNWEFGAATSPSSSNQLDPSNIVFPSVGTFPVSFNVVFENCNETFTSSVDIYDEDIFPVIPAQSSQCLEDNLFNFSAAGTYPAGSTFQWNFGTNASPQTSFQENPTAISFSSLGEQLITLNVLNNGCENAVQETVETIGIENLEIQSSPTEGCEPFTVEFSSLLNPNQHAFEWGLDNGIVSNASNPQSTYTEGIYDISLSVIDLNSLCKANVNIADYITVVPQPISSFSLLSNSLVYNDVVEITNNALYANSFLYEFSSGFTSTEFEPEYTIPSIGDFTIWQYVQNQYECIDSSSVDLFIEFEHTFWVPNVFTPNQNLINDYFFASYTNVESYRMQIFNRWGETVFDQEGEQPKWDGTDETRKRNLDKNEKSDNYVYLINYRTIEEKSYKLRGVVSLIR